MKVLQAMLYSINSYISDNTFWTLSCFRFCFQQFGCNIVITLQCSIFHKWNELIYADLLTLMLFDFEFHLLAAVVTMHLLCLSNSVN